MAKAKHTNKVCKNKIANLEQKKESLEKSKIEIEKEIDMVELQLIDARISDRLSRIDFENSKDAARELIRLYMDFHWEPKHVTNAILKNNIVLSEKLISKALKYYDDEYKDNVIFSADESIIVNFMLLVAYQNGFSELADKFKEYSASITNLDSSGFFNTSMINSVDESNL